MKKGLLINFEEELIAIYEDIYALRLLGEDDLPMWAEETSAAIEELLEIEGEVPSGCRKRLNVVRKWLCRTQLVNGEKGREVIRKAIKEMKSILRDYFDI